MKVSRKFLNDYVDISDLDIHDIAEKMTGVGNEYDSCGPLVEATKLVIGEVLECENHPDSDHLHVCKVNVGEEVLDIVCGAPNVRKGIKVIVALPGAKLPGGEIKKSVIRGVESNGMLCSIAELGLDHKYLKPEDIEGIHEVAEDVKVGEDALKALNYDDEVIDFELTSNRGDLLSILGMAYEVGAIYRRDVNQMDVNYPKEKGKMNFNLDIQTPRCSLFLAKKALNVKIKESPDFIKKRLIASGIRPINNIVDISNYVMLEVGQPLHYYDADSLGDTLIVRDAKEGEKLVTLDEQERILSEEDIVIANKNEAIGLAGVMGGLSTEVTEKTKNVLIEAAIFDSVSIRLTSKKILRSEASNRFEKGLDYNRTYMAMERSCALLSKYADATIIDDECIYDKIVKKDNKINITVDDINSLLGITLDKTTITDIFKALSFNVVDNGLTLEVTVPSRRLDISIKEDLVEEVARIYGIDNIPGKVPSLPLRRGSYNKFNRLIRTKLVSLGLNETMTYTLIPKSEVHKYTLDEFDEVTLLDPMSDDRSTLRYSLLPSLMMVYDYNSKRNNKDISIFEIGKSFFKHEEYGEEERLAILMSGNYKDNLYKEKINFYHLKGIMEELLDSLGYNGRYSLNTDNLPSELHPGSSANINLNGKNIGIIGKVHPNITKEDIYVLEINLTLLKSFRVGSLSFKEISKYPNIVHDVAFVVDNKVTNETLMKEIKKSCGKYLVDISLFDIYNIDKKTKSLAYNLVFNDPNTTLTDEVVMPIFEKMISDVTTKLNCKLRDN